MFVCLYISIIIGKVKTEMGDHRQPKLCFPKFSQITPEVGGVIGNINKNDGENATSDWLKVWLISYRKINRELINQSFHLESTSNEI